MNPLTYVEQVKEAARAANTTPKNLLTLAGYSEANVYSWPKHSMSTVMRDKLLAKAEELKNKPEPKRLQMKKPALHQPLHDMLAEKKQLAERTQVTISALETLIANL